MENPTHIQLQHRTQAVGHGRDDEGAEHDGHGNGFRVLIDNGPLLQAGVLVLGELADGLLQHEPMDEGAHNLWGMAQNKSMLLNWLCDSGCSPRGTRSTRWGRSGVSIWRRAHARSSSGRHPSSSSPAGRLQEGKPNPIGIGTVVSSKYYKYSKCRKQQTGNIHKLPVTAIKCNLCQSLTLGKGAEGGVAGDAEQGRHRPGKSNRNVGDLLPALHGRVAHRLINEEGVVMTHESCTDGCPIKR